LLEPEKAKAALLLFITFPAAVFLHAGYTESLFLFLTLLSFYLIEKKLYVAAALFGGLTSATRLVGIIMPTLFALLPIPFRKKLPLILISTVGILAYCSFLFINYHNPLYFAEAQKHWCKINSNCTVTFPIQTLYDKYLILPSVQTIMQEGIGTDTYNWIFSVLFIGLGITMIKSFPTPYWIYSLGIILFPLATGSTASMTRYVYLAFPVFFALSKSLSNKYLIGIVLLLFSIIQLTFINDFTNFIWVAFNYLLQNQV
jgi:Gpi18-like mannosyltransferase